MAGTAVVVSLTGADRCGGFLYTSCAPVGTENLSAQLQDFLCQLHPNSRILLMLNPSFCVLSAHKIRLFCCRRKVSVRRGTAPSSVSGRKRYNTLDFASKIVCQQGCSRPYWKPRAKGLHPSGHPAYFPRKWYPNCKNAV